MSGWDAQFLAGKTFGLLMVTMGLLQWLAPTPSYSPESERRVSDWQLRYGYGGTDLRQLPAPPPQWIAFMWIGFGALYLFVPRFAGRMEPLLLIIMGVFFLGIAVVGLLTEPWFEARRIRRYDARLETIAESAGPRSEDMRAALANPPRMTSRRRQLIVNLIFTLFGGAFLALGLAIPR